RREHRRRVERRQAEEVDRRVHAHERDRVQIADDAILAEGCVAVGHRLTLARRPRRGQAWARIRRIRATHGFGTQRGCRRWRTRRLPETFLFSGELAFDYFRRVWFDYTHVVVHAQTSRLPLSDS